MLAGATMAASYIGLSGNFTTFKIFSVETNGGQGEMVEGKSGKVSKGIVNGGVQH